MRFAFWALVFSLVCCQAPLYYSNQNQYFLQGLAAAGHGSLAEDWLAKTRDPTPVFSVLVEETYRFLPEAAFHLYYALLLGVYFVGLVGLFDCLTIQSRGTPEVGKTSAVLPTPALRFGFIALFMLVHSAALRWSSQRLLGQDYPWFLQAGVAGQYVLGAMLQPSVFGVSLILSLYLFLRERPCWAIVGAAVAATAHSTYLLPAGMLTLGYMYVRIREGRTRQALRLGALALVLVLPVTLYALIVFWPTSAEQFEQSQYLLAHFRIPHHCLPHLWLDWIAVAQIGWLLLAMFLVRGSRVFHLLLPVFLMSVVLTLLQIATASDALALLFPWRISAVLVPVATTIILTRFVLALAAWLDRRATIWISAGVVGVLAVAGLAVMAFRLGYQTDPGELPLMDYVREHNKSAGDVYLLPMVRQASPPARGSLSSDFVPLSAKRRDPRIIPIDLQRFRLATGAPIFVDFKSIPYKDTDVLEWRRRLEVNYRLTEQIAAGRIEAVRADLKKEGITHIVVTANVTITASWCRELWNDGDEYRNARYRVYRIVV